MKPEDVTGGDDFHSVTFLTHNHKAWLGKKDEASFRIKGEDTLVAQIDELIAEMTALIPEE